MLTCSCLQQVVTVNATHNADLLWALRGGGNGNFGVVTSLGMRVYRPPLEATAYTIEWPSAATSAEVLRVWQTWAPAAPTRLTSQLEVYGGLIIHSAGQVKMFLNTFSTYTHAHSTAVCVCEWQFMGSESDLRELLQPLTRIGVPTVKIFTTTFPKLVLDYSGCTTMSQVQQQALLQ